MGCAQSRIDNEESVARCKDRKILMKEAVAARNAFAAGHSCYAVSLKNTGAALSDYGLGESEQTQQQDQLHDPIDPTNDQPQPPPPPPMDSLPPPPPPLPIFSPSPIKRAVSLPSMPVKMQKGVNESDVIVEEDEEEGDEEGNVGGIGGKDDIVKDDLDVMRTPEKGSAGLSGVESNSVSPLMTEPKGMAWDYFFNVDHMPGPALDDDDDGGVEEDEDDEEESNVDNVGVDGEIGGDGEPKTPEKMGDKSEENLEKGEQIEHAKTAPPEFRRMGNGVPSVNLMQILKALDDHFLKASESAQEVSKMLEATRMHYHSNFADNRAHIDHSARVMRVITWNRSFRGIPNGDKKDDFDSEQYETHASVLDKLLAWEKKLYEEVKQGELMKLEYQRKVTLLNKQKKRSASAESLEKTKAAVSHLHTRYIVDMQSLDSTVSEVNRLRDEQLYPKLVAVVDGMANMWGSMCAHHDKQLQIVADLKSLDIGHAPKETTKPHHDRTQQLWNVIQEWQSQFEKLVTHQKQYIRILSSWLKLNIIPIESNLKEKISSPPRIQHPPIQALIHSWHDHLEKLPDELAKSAIGSFGAVIKTIILHQDEEMKLKEKCEETRKECMRKKQAFEEWYEKYRQRRGPDEMDAERGEDGKDPISERQFVVESLEKKLEEEIDAHQRLCIQVREKSLGNLKTRFPEVFRAMSDYALACSEAYEKLKAITRSQNSKSSS